MTFWKMFIIKRKVNSNFIIFGRKFQEKKKSQSRPGEPFCFFAMQCDTHLLDDYATDFSIDPA